LPSCRSPAYPQDSNSHYACQSYTYPRSPGNLIGRRP